ncbi:MAG: hypothetical protein M3O28_12475 [Actinomycetota bacterium]|nr:hypothetical protein [Actinomycetota bacterium]
MSGPNQPPSHPGQFPPQTPGQYPPPPVPGQYAGPSSDQHSPTEMGPLTTKFAKIDPGPTQRFGAVSALFTAVGTVFLVLAFTVTNWFKSSPDASHLRDVHHVLTLISPSPIAKAYFGWLAWVLLVAAVVAALLAATPTIATPFRVLGVVIAAAGIGLTFAAIHLYSGGAPNSLSYGTYLRNARLAFYLAIVGFIVVGIGAGIGPRQERTPA